jgi:hypothetical protein
MSDGEIAEKFHSLADAMLPADRLGAILEQLWNLDQMRDIGTLIGMTVM